MVTPVSSLIPRIRAATFSDQLIIRVLLRFEMIHLWELGGRFYPILIFKNFLKGKLLKDVLLLKSWLLLQRPWALILFFPFMLDVLNETTKRIQGLPNLPWHEIACSENGMLVSEIDLLISTWIVKVWNFSHGIKISPVVYTTANKALESLRKCVTRTMKNCPQTPHYLSTKSFSRIAGQFKPDLRHLRSQNGAAIFSLVPSLFSTRLNCSLISVN